MFAKLCKGLLACWLIASAQATAAAAGPPDAGIPAQAYSELQWRSIGPFRGGRAVAVAGVPGSPNIFYFGAAAGGVWKTIDAGRDLEAHLRCREGFFHRRHRGGAQQSQTSSMSAPAKPTCAAM